MFSRLLEIVEYVVKCILAYFGEASNIDVHFFVQGETYYAELLSPQPIHSNGIYATIGKRRKSSVTLKVIAVISLGDCSGSNDLYSYYIILPAREIEKLHYPNGVLSLRIITFNPHHSRSNRQEFNVTIDSFASK